jgi:hypothetical protein
VPEAHTIILAIWEAEIRRIAVQGQPKQILWEYLFGPSPKYLEQNELEV